MIIGSKILNYEVISLIGEGGMGDVYLAEHTSIGRKVAIKVLKPELAKNDQIRTRFKNEASVMAHMQHPNIVNLIDYLETEDGLFLVMEYVEGQELSQLLQSLTQPIELNRARNIMIGILDAFAYAHKSGIVHRDVKPSNILIDANDNVKVLDFGIAKLVGDSQFNLTKTGTQIGTVYYMSPEQVKAKELDHRTDIYSLGVTFYELFSGFCPYKGLTSEFEVYSSIVEKELPDLTLSMGNSYKTVWEVIRKATAKNPNDRFQSCEEFKKALKSDLTILPDPRPESAKRKSNVGILIFIVSIILVAGAGIVGYNLYFAGDNAGTDATGESMEPLQNSGENEQDIAQIPEGSNTDEAIIDNWLSVNLKVAKFRNGDPIYFASNAEQWIYCSELGIPAYAFPEFNTEYSKYGFLYNFNALTDSRGLIPNGQELVNQQMWRDAYVKLGHDKLFTQLNILKAGHITATGASRNLGMKAYYWAGTSSFETTNSKGEMIYKAPAVIFEENSTINFTDYEIRDGMFVKTKSIK